MNTKIITKPCFILTVLVLFTFSTSADTINLTGKVVDSYGPVFDAKVTVRDALNDGCLNNGLCVSENVAPNPAKTDSGGNFIIRIAPPGYYVEYNITIEKDDYESEEIDITFVITMEEIYPGVPTFYFILITAAIVGVIGSLVSYRVIQQARIPGFVKKLRKIKRTIKTKKPITEGMLTPPKERWIIKTFGKDWEELGLSIKEVIEEKKPKKSFKEGGGVM